MTDFLKPDVYDHAEHLCTGLTDIFYGETRFEVERAKAICGTCSSRSACLAYALEAEEEEGVWGGLSAPERMVLIRQARRARGVRITRRTGVSGRRPADRPQNP